MSDYSRDREALYHLQWDEGEARMDNIGINGGTGEHYMEALKEYIAAINKKEEATAADKHPKYFKYLPKQDTHIDVYDVLYAFEVDNPAIAHAIKKMLCAGTRGYKDFQQDVQEAIDSLERAKDFPPIPF